MRQSLWPDNACDRPAIKKRSLWTVSKRSCSKSFFENLGGLLLPACRYNLSFGVHLLLRSAIMNHHHFCGISMVAWHLIKYLNPATDNLKTSKHLHCFLDMDDSVAVQIRLECIRSRYGPQCSTRCLPPTERHVCDQVTGKLRCAKGWNGRECDAKGKPKRF